MLRKIQEIKSHKGFLKYFKNTSWMFVEYFLRIISGLYVGIWVARYLGPEQFGLFGYIVALAAIFGSVAKLGLDGIVVRELINNPDKQDSCLGTAFWLKVIGSFFVISLTTSILPIINNDAKINLYVYISIAGLIFQSFEVVEFYFQSQVLAKIVTICKVVQLLISTLIKIYLILIEAELIYFVSVSVFDAFSLAISYYIAYRIEKRPTFIYSFDVELAKKMLKDSFPLILVGMASMINMRIDQVILGGIMGYEVLGNYTAAVRVAELWLIIPVIIGQSIFPAIMSAHKQGIKFYRRRVFDTIKYMSIFAIPFATVVTLYSDEIIFALYGAKYKEAGLYLSLYIWTGLPFIVLFVVSHVYMIENLTKWSLYVTIFVVVANAPIAYTVIPIFGGVGAIVTTLLVTYCSQAIMMLILYNKTKLFKN